MPTISSTNKRIYFELCMAFVLWSGIRGGVVFASTSRKLWSNTASSTISTITRLGNVAFLHTSNRSLSFCSCSVTTRWFSGGDTEKNATNILTPTTSIATEDLPFRQFGYRSSPFSWEELKQIIVHDKQLARLSRSVDIERRYKSEKEELSKIYETIYDHILHTKFNFERRLDKDNGKWKAFRPQCDADSEIFKISLVKNDYPYFVAPGIEHWVLWKLYSEISMDDVAQALADLKSKYDDVLDMIWWENPPSLKSLPDINHIHILVRRKSNLK
jgi:hypothetical protein